MVVSDQTVLKVKQYVNKLRMPIIFVILIVAFSLLSPNFLKKTSLIAIGLTTTAIGIVCIGQSLVLLSQGFDLSVGSIAAFSGMVVAFLTKQYSHFWIMFFVGLAIGSIIGLINGILITKVNINPLITTLGMMSIFRGATFIVSKGYAISVSSDNFRVLGTMRISGIPISIIILFSLYIIFYFLLKHSVLGRLIYSIGGNSEAAKLSGINVDRIRIIVYILSGIFSALGGIVLTSRLGAAQTTTGNEYPLQSIAACILGGISISGGEGNILVSLVGILIIGVVQAGLIMIEMPSYYQWIVSGIILIVAVAIDSMKKR